MANDDKPAVSVLSTATIKITSFDDGTTRFEVMGRGHAGKFAAVLARHIATMPDVVDRTAEALRAN